MNATISLPACLDEILRDAQLTSGMKAYAHLLVTHGLRITYDEAAQKLGFTRKSVERLERALIKAGYLRVSKTYVNGQLLQEVDRSFRDSLEQAS